MSRIVFILTFSLGCAPLQTTAQPSKTAHQIDELSIPSLPEWTDRYAASKTGDVRFFNLTRLMTKYKLNRLQAVELQNSYRDITRAEADVDRSLAFERALNAVRAGKLESKIDLESLAQAKFIVVFDLDETLYDQYYSGGEACNTVAFKRANGSTKYIHMVPGWQDAIKGIVELGGKVVIFSANLDHRNYENLSQIKLDGIALTKHPSISGIMTNSHLIQQHKMEPPGSAEKPSKGRPVLEPSKDLRHFDPTLENVIIVDDNPLRLFQFGNTRVFKKFHADKYCDSSKAAYKDLYDRAMPVVFAEIKESVSYMDANPGVSFAQAYLPYTVLGQITVDFVRSGRRLDLGAARDYVRKHPELADTRF